MPPRETYYLTEEQIDELQQGNSVVVRHKHFGQQIKLQPNCDLNEHDWRYSVQDDGESIMRTCNICGDRERKSDIDLSTGDWELLPSLIDDLGELAEERDC